VQLAGPPLRSFLSPLVRRLLPVRAVLLLELWTWLGCAVFLVWPSVYVLTAGILPTALAIPSTDSVVHGYRIAMTPDRLIGRAESVRSTISLVMRRSARSRPESYSPPFRQAPPSPSSPPSASRWPCGAH